jgi:hypothetical protein
MNPGDVIAVLITVLLPTLFLFYAFRRWFAYKDKQLEVQAFATAQRAAGAPALGHNRVPASDFTA